MKNFIIFMILTVSVLLMMLSCGENTEEIQNPATEAEPNITEAEEIPEVTEPPVPLTEPEPTTEKPVINYEIIKRFDFDDPDDIGWRATNQIQNFRVEDGVLKLTSIGGDPFFTASEPLNIAAEEIDIIRVRVKNMTDNDRCQLFFDTDTENGLSESKSYREYYTYIESEPESDEWNEVLFYTYECDLWEGIIKTVRFDPSENEGDVYIDYISFEKRMN